MAKIKNREIIFSEDFGNPLRFPIDKFPNECPQCHKGIEVTPYVELVNIVNINNEYKKSLDNKPPVEIIFRCPSCYKFFIAVYKKKHEGNIDFFLVMTLPSKIKNKAFEKEVKDISPRFIEIYNQSEKGEVLGLSEIAGCGFRKSLEILVKDYCINHLKCDQKLIKKERLGDCIDKYIDNIKIKDCAKRAVWIGNDETHYERKWENKEISDLKVLINLTVAWIIHEAKTSQFIKQMP